MPLGDSVTDATLFGEFSRDSARLLVGEATFGQADCVRVFESDGTIVGDIAMGKGVAIKECRLASDGEAIIAVVQEASDASAASTGPETLRIFEVDSGDFVSLATSRPDRGGEAIHIVGLPDDLAVWEQ
jgi:hypothetical protein